MTYMDNTEIVVEKLTGEERNTFIDITQRMLKRIRRQEKKDYERRNKIQVLTGEWITEAELQNRINAFNKK